MKLDDFGLSTLLLHTQRGHLIYGSISCTFMIYLDHAQQFALWLFLSRETDLRYEQLDGDVLLFDLTTSLPTYL